jgi:hypothetical protein
MLTATSANITGAITATSGTIGGWTVNGSPTNTITGGNATLAASGNLTLGTGNDVCRISADDATYRLWIGNATAGSASFRVGKNGALTCSGATVSGALTATSGSIMGTLAVSGGALTAGGGAVTLDNNGISLTSGSSAANQIKFSSGSLIKDVSGTLTIGGNGPIGLEANGGAAAVGLDSSNAALFPYAGTLTLGTVGSPWADLYLSGSGSLASVLSNFEDRISALESA